MPEPIFRIDRLTKTFGDNTVVDDLSLDIQPGECLGVIGPNGAGKTTTIRMCLGHDRARRRADRGLRSCRFPQQVREAKKRIGVVTQFDSLDPDFTCAENLLVYGRYFGLPTATIEARIPKLLEFSALQAKANARPGELSGGMRRRLSLGRALINDPDLLLLDEPTTGLDPQARHLMWERLQNLLQQGKSILLTTHFMDEAERLCDRLLVLDHGRKIAEGTPRGLIGEHLESDVVEVYGDGARAAAETHGELAERVETSGETVFFYLRDPQPLLQALATRPPGALPAPPRQPGGPVPQADRPADPRRRLIATGDAHADLVLRRAAHHAALLSGRAAQPAGLAQARGAERRGQYRRAADHAGRLWLRPGLDDRRSRRAALRQLPRFGQHRRQCALAATFEALYSAFSRMQVQKTWESIMNAPIALDDIVFAEMLWAALKASFRWPRSWR